MDAKEYLEWRLGVAWEDAVPLFNAEIRIGRNHHFCNKSYVAIKFFTPSPHQFAFGKIIRFDMPNAADEELLGHALIEMGRALLARPKGGDPS